MYTKTYSKQIYAAAIIAAMTSSSAFAAIVGIDNFNQTTQHLQFDPNEGTHTVAGASLFEEIQTQPGESIGGYRDLFIQTNDAINFNDNGEVAVVSDRGQMQISNSGNSTINVAVTWDGQDNSADVNTTGLGGIDLTDGGLNSSFGLNLLGTDHDVNMEIKLWDMSGGQGSVSTAFDPALAGQQFFLDFDGLNSTVDLANIGAIQLLISGPQAYDLQFNFLQSAGAPPTTPVPGTAVSAPATLTLVGFGLLGIGLTRNKRTKKPTKKA
jgi:hypothetical protein